MVFPLDIVNSIHSNNSFKLIDRLKRLNALRHICPVLDHQIEGSDGNDFSDESIFDIIRDTAPDVRKTMAGIVACKTYMPKNCSTVVPIFTEEGVCLSFNALNSHDIYTDE